MMWKDEIVFCSSFLLCDSLGFQLYSIETPNNYWPCTIFIRMNTSALACSHSIFWHHQFDQICFLGLYYLDKDFPYSFFIIMHVGIGIIVECTLSPQRGIVKRGEWGKIRREQEEWGDLERSREQGNPPRWKRARRKMKKERRERKKWEGATIQKPWPEFPLERLSIY